MRSSYSHATLLLTLILGQAAHAQTTPPAELTPLPKTMVSIGDSITAGAVAGLSRSGFYNPFHLLKLLGTLIEAGVKWSAYGAIQDRHYSWSTGLSSDYSVTSHAHRLAYMHTLQNSKMQVTSVSWSGDDSKNLKGQVNAALKWNQSKNGDGGPEYTTILIGPNDICADNVNNMTADRDFYNNVDEAVSRLVNANPKAKVLLSSIPDVNSLHAVARNSPLMGVGPIATCKAFWERANVCYTLTRLPANSLDRHIVGEKVLAMNRILSEIAERVNAQTQTRSVAFSPSVYEQKFSDKDISVDCFHPNQRGQNMLAKATWSDSFWSKKFDNNAYNKYVDKIKAKKRKKLGPPHR